MTQAKLNQCRPRYISQCLELSPTGALIYHQFRLCTLLCKVIYLINYFATMAITFCFKKVRFGDALNHLLILKEHFTRFHERYLSQGNLPERHTTTPGLCTLNEILRTLSGKVLTVSSICGPNIFSMYFYKFELRPFK